MDAGFLNMFHHAGDIDRLAIANAVHIHFAGFVQIAVDQHRVFSAFARVISRM